VNLNENISTILDTLLLGCSIIIFVFDLGNEISFTKVMRFLNKIDEMENVNANLLKIIIGNKTDFKEDKKNGKLNSIFKKKFFSLFKAYA